MTLPNGLQLDLLTACLRIRQVWEEDGGGTSLGELLLQRLFTCDVPRLEGYLTAETLAWAAEQGLPAPVEAPPTFEDWLIAAREQWDILKDADEEVLRLAFEAGRPG